MDSKLKKIIILFVTIICLISCNWTKLLFSPTIKADRLIIQNNSSQDLVVELNIKNLADGNIYAYIHSSRYCSFNIGENASNNGFQSLIDNVISDTIRVFASDSVTLLNKWTRPFFEDNEANHNFFNINSWSYSQEEQKTYTKQIFTFTILQSDIE